MRLNSILSVSALAFVLLFGAGCGEEGAMEQATEAMEDAADAVGDAADDAADAMGDAADDAADEIEDAVDG